VPVVLEPSAASWYPSRPGFQFSAALVHLQRRYWPMGIKARSHSSCHAATFDF